MNINVNLTDQEIVEVEQFLGKLTIRQLNSNQAVAFHKLLSSLSQRNVVYTEEALKQQFRKFREEPTDINAEELKYELAQNCWWKFLKIDVEALERYLFLS